MKEYLQTSKEVLQNLKSSAEGLSMDEAQERLDKTVKTSLKG